MRISVVLAALLAGLPLLADWPDWLNEGGDARRSNYQPLERDLSPANAGQLKLIWKRKLGDGAALSSPVILGRLITYRGSIELVFVAGSDGRVYAVDGDFGGIFWTVPLESKSHRCPSPATPALTPNTQGPDDDDDAPQPLRYLYILAPDAMVHALDPINGKIASSVQKESCAPSLIVRKDQPELANLSPNIAVWTDAQGARHQFPKAVVAGGVAFVLEKTTGELKAFDALTHKLLYRGESTGATTSALAVADGHICYTGPTSVLYCYGFPVEP